MADCDMVNFKFFKYQACGNDFIIRDELDAAPVPEEKRGVLAKRLCQRNFGIGADGLIFIASSKDADAKMRLFDRDGPEADMCGNGIRCVAAYLHGKWSKDKTISFPRLGEVKVSVKERWRSISAHSEKGLGFTNYLLPEIVPLDFWKVIVESATKTRHDVSGAKQRM
ncbi:MAG: Diaminopimelate epimerase [Dehalococcoidia bacterium]|nr:Diaminopimelate epimerase [Bacillota bacterium]MBT9163153.1 Diaminopimelate epimerase [Chloroflexota bacterium]